jgi:hypothetical protein
VCVVKARRPHSKPSAKRQSQGLHESYGTILAPPNIRAWEISTETQMNEWSPTSELVRMLPISDELGNNFPPILFSVFVLLGLDGAMEDCRVCVLGSNGCVCPPLQAYACVYAYLRVCWPRHLSLRCRKSFIPVRTRRISFAQRCKLCRYSTPAGILMPGFGGGAGVMGCLFVPPGRKRNPRWAATPEAPLHPYPPRTAL